MAWVTPRCRVGNITVTGGHINGSDPWIPGPSSGRGLVRSLRSVAVSIRSAGLDREAVGALALVGLTCYLVTRRVDA